MNMYLSAIGAVWMCTMALIGVMHKILRPSAIVFAAVPGFQVFWYGVTDDKDLLRIAPMTAVPLIAFGVSIILRRRYRGIQESLADDLRSAMEHQPVWRRRVALGVFVAAVVMLISAIFVSNLLLTVLVAVTLLCTSLLLGLYRFT